MSADVLAGAGCSNCSVAAKGQQQLMATCKLTCGMCMQVIGLLKDAFQKAGLDLYLAPYGALPTAYECGIIEVVPEASSRSALGETSDAGLYEIFQREFGAPGTESFEIARHNFILSSAG